MSGVCFLSLYIPPYIIAWKDEDVANVDSMQYLAGWMAYAASQVCVVA